MSVPDFRRVVRGYDTDHVARYVRELNERLERLENERAENARSIQRLNRDVTDANDRAGRANRALLNWAQPLRKLFASRKNSPKKSPRKQPQKLQRFWATPGAKQRGSGIRSQRLTENSLRRSTNFRRPPTGIRARGGTIAPTGRRRNRKSYQHENSCRASVSDHA